jgi:diaminopimelate epimerase
MSHLNGLVRLSKLQKILYFEQMKFCKYSATGNDFILIDNRADLGLNWSQKALKYCPRRTSVGADGIILLENDESQDFKMRLFNADGSEGEMCGNGTRAITHFAHEVLKLKSENQYVFRTMNGVYRSEISGNIVKVQMSEVSEARSLDYFEYGFQAFVDTGVPHVVLQGNVGTHEAARAIRNDKRFPKGANVNFITIESEGVVSAKTFERGVEDFTLSCGTGVTAIAKSLNQLKGWNSPIKVKTPGGEFTMHFDEHFYLEGPVELVYSGELLEG